jgi:hypothetical protein
VSRCDTVNMKEEKCDPVKYPFCGEEAERNKENAKGAQADPKNCTILHNDDDFSGRPGDCGRECERNPRRFVRLHQVLGLLGIRDSPQCCGATREVTFWRVWESSR